LALRDDDDDDDDDDEGYDDDQEEGTNHCFVSCNFAGHERTVKLRSWICRRLST